MVAAITSVDIRRRSNATLLGASASMLAIAMSITASGVALAHVDIGANIGIMHLQWVMNGFILSFAAFLLPFGSLVDRIGGRQIFLSGCVIFTLATVVSIAAGSFTVLMVGRLLQGIGAAQLAAAGPPALAAMIDDDAQRKRAFGYLGASGGIGLTLGAFLSGIVLVSGGWRAAFALHLPFAVASFLFALRGFGDRRKASKLSFDWLGSVLSAVCITAAMTFGISGSVLGWFSPAVIGALLVACFTAWAFVHVEARSAVPLIRISMLRNRQFVLACAVCVLFTTVWVALFIYVPLNLSAGHARGGEDVGATMLALMIPALIMPIVASRYVQRVRIEIVLACGFVLIVLGLASLFVAWSDERARLHEIGGLIVCGAGAGTLYGLADYYALSAVPTEQTGLASGAFNLLRLAGDALGSIVPAAVLLDALRDGLTSIGAAEMPRNVLNELAAGRFSAIDTLYIDAVRADLMRGVAFDSFQTGMLRALVALAAFAAAGILLLVVPLIRPRRPR